MKPLRLVMNAFCSYEGCVEIPFEKLNGQGLYLITGPTGAGKTTIFDAICFALFGTASGDARRDKALLRNGTAAPDTETYVDFTFSHGADVYRVRRNLEYQRQAKRGTGTITEDANAVLYYPGGRAPLEKTEAVTEEIARILGIRREHFSKIAMIAQGDFAKLLLSGVNERRAILQSIFGTHYYYLVEETLSRREKALAEQWRALQSRIEEGYGRLVLAEGRPEAQAFDAFRQPGSAYRFPQWKELAEAITKSDAESLAAGLEERKKMQAAVQQNLLAQAEGKRINEGFLRLQEAQKALNLLLEKGTEAEAMQTALSLSEAAARMDKDAQRCADGEKALFETAKKIQETAAALDALKRRLPGLQTQAQALEEKKPEAEKARREAERMISLLPQYGELARLETALTSALQTAKGAEIRRETAQSQEKRLAEEGKQATLTRETLSGADAALAEKKAALENTKTRLAALIEVGKGLRAYTAGQDALAKAQQGAEETLRLAEKETDRHKELRRVFLLSQAGLMARELSEGMPCPVCGSPSHPRKAPLPLETPIQAQVEEAEKAAHTASENAQAASHKAQALIVRQEAEWARLCGEWAKYCPAPLSMGEAETMVRAQQKAAAQLAEEVQALALQSERLAQLRELLPKLDKALTHAREELRVAEKEKEAAEKALAVLTAQRDALLATLPFPQRQEAENRAKILQNAFEQWNSSLHQANEALRQCGLDMQAREGALKALEEQRSAQRLSLEEWQEAFRQALFREGFPHEEAFRRAGRSQEDMAKLKKDIAGYNAALLQAQNTTEALAGELAGQHPCDLPALLSQGEALKKQEEALQNQTEQLRLQLAMNTALIRELQELNESFSALDKTYTMVSNLSRTAGGKSVQDEAGRQSFELFVQSELFDQVIFFANQRFSQMTGGQYELVREASFRSKRTLFGLDLNVRDHFTGSERPVQTLSGGESFMASLSLALGFSDAISSHSGGIVMDALFVDEGFGTLDEQTLDLVMNTLAKLAQGDKLVGLISHVPELRRRIDRQIVVRKEKTGGSTASVVC